MVHGHQGEREELTLGKRRARKSPGPLPRSGKCPARVRTLESRQVPTQVFPPVLSTRGPRLSNGRGVTQGGA
jgi:hypothetical protein